MLWGAWAITGMASRNAKVLARIEQSGMGLIHPIQGLKALHLALTNEVVPALIVNPFRWYDILQTQKSIPAIFSEQIHRTTPQVFLNLRFI